MRSPLEGCRVRCVTGSSVSRYLGLDLASQAWVRGASGDAESLLPPWFASVSAGFAFALRATPPGTSARNARVEIATVRPVPCVPHRAQKARTNFSI